MKRFVIGIVFVSLFWSFADPNLATCSDRNTIRSDVSTEKAATFPSKEKPDPTQQEIIRVSRKIVQNKPLNRLDAQVLLAFWTAVEESGSPELREFIAASSELHRSREDSIVLAEVFALMEGKPSETSKFEKELRKILSSFPSQPNETTRQFRDKVHPLVPIIIGSGICGLSIAAFEADAWTLYDQCLSGTWCAVGGWGDSNCCQGLFESDILNCWVTCGSNGPDRDAVTCCRYR